jgi:hypothetical protein
MKAQLAIVSVCAALMAVATVPAEAKGCAKGAVVGGIGGHVAGHHGLLGAAAGCAIGRHHAKKMARREREQQAATQRDRDDTRAMGNNGTYTPPARTTYDKR